METQAPSNVYIATEIMAKKQDSLNESIYPNWRSHNFNWHTAIFCESAEAIESIGYKWWKKTNPDWDNVKVEIVDIFHFFISYWLNNGVGIKEFSESMSKQYDEVKQFNYIKQLDSHEYSEALISTIKDIYLYCTFVVSKDYIYMRDALNNGCYSMSLVIDALFDDYETFAKNYLVKNILNHFRQTHGYKDGSYKKIWNGEEDNVVTYTFAKNIPLDEGFEASLLEQLECYYKQV